MYNIVNYYISYYNFILFSMKNIIIKKIIKKASVVCSSLNKFILLISENSIQIDKKIMIRNENNCHSKKKIRYREMSQV